MTWKPGDVVRLMNLHESWGTFALITRVVHTQQGTGQIYLIANGMSSAIPILKADDHICGVITERNND